MALKDTDRKPIDMEALRELPDEELHTELARLREAAPPAPPAAEQPADRVETTVAEMPAVQPAHAGEPADQRVERGSLQAQLQRVGALRRAARERRGEYQIFQSHASSS